MRKSIRYYTCQQIQQLFGGYAVDMFIQFSNPEMKGFSVYAARGFKTELSNEFLRLWKSCESDLDINLKNPMTGHLILKIWK